MAKLDINGYNATFRTFVEFAQKTQRDGYDSACAKATLAGKLLTVSALSLHETSYFMKATGASEEMAFEVVSTPGTRANHLMNCGGRFLFGDDIALLARLAFTRR